MENILKVIAVIALLVLAAMLATPKGRLPLALRGINKLLRRDGTSANQSSVVAPTWKRLIAFMLVVLATILAMI